MSYLLQLLLIIALSRVLYNFLFLISPVYSHTLHRLERLFLPFYDHHCRLVTLHSFSTFPFFVTRCQSQDIGDILFAACFRSAPHTISTSVMKEVETFIQHARTTCPESDQRRIVM